MMQQPVYLNGEIVDEQDAKISINDRGFVLADGIYEVIRVFDGAPFLFDEHLTRLERSAAALRLTLDPSAAEIGRIAVDLLARRGLDEAQIYIQVTRGVAPRAHGFPSATVKPTTLVAVHPAISPAPELLKSGGAAITLPDDRWARCDVKAIGLTANVLARQQAIEAGTYEAIFVRDGSVADGSSSNVFSVFGTTLATAPCTNYVLWGVTRDLILALAREDGIDVMEASFRVEQLREADELFVTGTNSGIVPIVTLDGETVGGGRVGPLTRRLMALYEARTRGPR
ncbi:MAG: D-amino-acid transaminase [Chloroflexi bacterium]|nr:D-amino-acid transaminase [Chloroflexota bacterium]